MLYRVNVPRRLAVFRLGLSYCQGSVALQEKYLKLKLYWILMQMGYLTLQLKDLDTLKEQKITITGSNKTSKEEIVRARNGAEQFETITRRKKEEAEIKNEARDLINKVSRGIKEELGGIVRREQIISITNYAKEARSCNQ